MPDEFSIELMRAVRRQGAIPIIEVRHSRINREVMLQTTEPHARFVRDIELSRMKRMKAYIAVRGADNASESSDVPSSLTKLYSKTVRPVQEHRVKHTRWRAWRGTGRLTAMRPLFASSIRCSASMPNG